MKKLIFGLAALFMMSVVLMSCGDKKSSKKDKDDEDVASVYFTPEDQLVDYLKDITTQVKRIHIESEDDAKVLADEVRKFQNRVEDLISKYGNGFGETLPENEQVELKKTVQGLIDTCNKEFERLKQEANAVGVDLNDWIDLNIF